MADAIFITDHFLADYNRTLYFEATDTPDNVTPAWTAIGGNASNTTVDNSDGTNTMTCGDVTATAYYWRRTNERAFDNGGDFTAILDTKLTTQVRVSGYWFYGFLVASYDGETMFCGFHDVAGSLKIGFFKTSGGGASIGTTMDAVTGTRYKIRCERDSVNEQYHLYVNNVLITSEDFADFPTYASPSLIDVGYYANVVTSTGTAIIYRWEFSSQGPLIASDEDANYPARNLWSKSQSKVYRTSDGYAEVNLVKTFGEAVAVDFFALLNVNLTSNATVKIQGNATDSWGAPSFTQAVTVTNIDTEKAVFFKFASTETYQYWRLVIEDDSEDLRDAYYQIGEWILGECAELEHNWSWGYTKKTIQNNVDHVTPYGKVWSYNRNVERMYNLNFDNAKAALHTDMLAIFNAAKGSNAPLVFVPNPDNDTEPLYMRLMPALEVSHPWLNVYNLNVDLVEDPRGLDVG